MRQESGIERFVVGRGVGGGGESGDGVGEEGGGWKEGEGGNERGGNGGEVGLPEI